MKAEFTKITPELAKSILERSDIASVDMEDINDKQRRRNSKLVEKYAGDMLSKRWHENHQGICIDLNGFVVDGQHRLSAVVLSGVTIWMMVTRGNVKVRDGIDGGSARTVAFLAGMTRSRVAVCNVVDALERGTISVSSCTPGGITEVEDRNRTYIDAVFQVVSEKAHKGLPASCLGALVYAMPVDQKKTIEFLVKVKDGEMLTRNQPEYRLREMLNNKSFLAGYSGSVEIISATLNALRYSTFNRNLSNLYTTPGGYEAFTTRRRVMNVPNTSHSSIVMTRVFEPTGGHS